MVEAARSRWSRMNQALPKGGYHRPQPARHGDELRDPLFRGWFRARLIVSELQVWLAVMCKKPLLTQRIGKLG